MTDIAIFWDASQLWGLLVWRAAEAFGLPYRLVKAKEIAQGALSDKTSLLLVPGGTARHKSAAQKKGECTFLRRIPPLKSRSQLRSPVRSVRRVTLWMVPSGS